MMTWIVDTCVLLDILDDIRPFAEALTKRRNGSSE